MKASITAAGFAIMATVVTATAAQKPVIVSYPNDTPNSVLDDAKAAILKLGGVITHEYNLIKGFAAEASEEALQMVQTLGQGNKVLVEQDQVVSINHS